MGRLFNILLCRKIRQRAEKRQGYALHICMAMILMFTAVFSGMTLTFATDAEGASKQNVLVAYFGRYGNTDFGKDVDAPQAMESFIKAHNLNGKTIIPFCTHGGSGQSGTYKKIQKLCSGADTISGFAASDETIKSKAVQKRLKAWLEKIDVKSRAAKAVPITIKIGSRTLEGVCYNTALGKQVMKKFPLTVTMDNFGDREYYGEVAKKDRPTKKSKGKLAFINGDITYCFENDTMAIFYNQSDDPDLTMRVNCVGRVTSSLSSFRKMGDSVTVTFDLKK